MNRRVLIVAAHPDDELLGVGGTAVKHVASGDEVRAVIACEGATVRYGAESVPDQEGCAREAAAVLGVSEVIFLRLPDQRLDTLPILEITKRLEAVMEEFRPQDVYIHHAGDANGDHRVIHRAMLVATRPCGGQIERLFSFETPSSTEWGLRETPFHPNVFVDISLYLERKLAAFRCYPNEMRAYPHPRSVEALTTRARYWGSLVGVEAAEAFQAERILWR